MKPDAPAKTYEQLLNDAITASAQNNLPPTAPIVAMFASNYRPVVPPTTGGDNMTSFEIVQTLEDTCSLSTQDVALTMAFLGYRLYVNEYKGHEWSMVATKLISD